MPNSALWPLLVYAGLAAIVVAGMLGLSYVLGQRHTAPARNRVYESGILATGSARIRFDASFYLVAVFFVVFDLEAAFVFAWAVALRAAGWTGYIDILIFIAVLVAALIYLWRLGALDWATNPSVRIQEEAVSHGVVADQSDAGHTAR